MKTRELVIKYMLSKSSKEQTDIIEKIKKESLKKWIFM